MGFPVKVCVVCGEEFELRPDKPGFANRCWECSGPEAEETVERGPVGVDGLGNAKEANEARRTAMRELLYRKDG